MPVRFKPWWWTDETGKLLLTLRYGNKPLELEKGKPTIEIAQAENLLTTLNLVKEAAGAGELDKKLMAAKSERTPKLKV